MMKRLSNQSNSPTIREVAQRAGVSVATASYALNQNGRVAEATRNKVREAAEALGYSPSIAAQVLKGGKGNLVAILTDGFAGPWYGEILEGLQPALKEAGYVVLAITIQRESLDLCRNLANAGLIRGLVVLNPGSAWVDAIKSLADTVPTVVFDPDSRYDRAACFVLDNRGGITTLMTHLWNRGYRDYLWLDGDLEAAWDARERWSAFSDFLDTKGLPDSARHRASGGFRTEPARRSVGEFLSKGRIPRVIVAANDESAVGALRAVRELDFQVPADIAIAGFDGLDMTAWTDPSLTTLRYDRRAMGGEMAATLLAAIGAEAPDFRVRTIPVELVIRASS
jgi:LacI family transcriptional regulator